MMYAIDVAGKMLRTSAVNPLTFADVVDHLRQLKQDPLCAGPMDVLLDLRSTNFLPQSTELNAVVSEVSGIRDKVQFGNLAMVAQNDALYGMMRMFEVTARDYFRATRVFRGMNEAEAWLNGQKVEDSSEELAG
jgi:hypothetical protein